MSDGVFAELELDKEQKDTLNEIDKKQKEFETENDETLDSYEKNLQDMLEGKEHVDIEQLAKIDRSLERGKQFNSEVTDLAESLTQELNNFGQFVGDMSNYQGMEKLISKISRKWADKKRLARVKNADVTTNLKTILDYGHYMVSKLNNALIENMKCYSRVEGTINTTNERLETHQPQYEEWQAKREKLERDLKELEEKMNDAGPDEYAKLETEKSKLDKDYHEAQTTENYHFTIVDKAKKALPVQRTHLTGYKDMIDSLKQFKTGLEQDLDHVTQVYLSAPTAIKTALSVKAASQYDKGMKYATDMATDAVLKSVEGILDETASRAERPLIEDEKLQSYRKVQQEMRAHYDKRVDQLKKTYAEPGRRVD